MNNLSIQKLEKYLKSYSMHLDYWTPDEGDSDIMNNARIILQKNIENLTDAQLEQLDTLDEKAIELLDNYHGEDTWDVLMLRDCVELAHQKEELFA